MDYEVVVERDLTGERLSFAGDKLVEFDGQVVILNERFSLEIEYGHQSIPLIDTNRLQ